MATPQENLASALARAETARSQGNEARAQVWEASADRYRRLIEIQQRIDTAKSNVEAIKERLEQAKNPPTVYGTPNPNPVVNPPKRPPAGEDSGYAPSGYQQVATVAPVPPVPTTPTAVSPVAVAAPVVPVKTAPIDTILYPSDDLLPIEIMSDLIFENIGGQELINIARNDTVNGQAVIYQPIKNLTQIQQQYNPNNIVALQETSDKYFQNFAIKLETKVPEEGSGPDGAHVYIDPNTGDLVVEAINLEPGEQVELEITTSGTIYEAEL